MSGSGKGEAEPSSGLSPWEIVGERELATCPVFDLVSRRLRHPRRKSEGEFFVLKTRDWVNVIPLTKDFEVVLVRQYRFGIEAFSWELPGGVMDAGEDPVEAAARELKEETGYVSNRLERIGGVASNPALCNNTCHFVLADQATPTGVLDWDEHEELETGLFPIDSVYEMARTGQICHSLVVAALFQFYPQWERIKARRRG